MPVTGSAHGVDAEIAAAVHSAVITEPRLPYRGMRPSTEASPGVPQQAAKGMLVLFLAAIVTALLVTLVSVAPPVRLLAGSVVLPILALGLFFLYLEGRGRAWSFIGAALLGAVGVSLRLLINAHPDLEVGGGLPLAVTVVYATLGLLLVATSVWAFSATRSATPDASGPLRR